MRSLKLVTARWFPTVRNWASAVINQRIPDDNTYQSMRCYGKWRWFDNVTSFGRTLLNNWYILVTFCREPRRFLIRSPKLQGIPLRWLSSYDAYFNRRRICPWSLQTMYFAFESFLCVFRIASSFWWLGSSSLLRSCGLFRCGLSTRNGDHELSRIQKNQRTRVTERLPG